MMKGRTRQTSNCHRSTQSRARRRAIQRAHQRETWARRQRLEDDLLSELQSLEDTGIKSHASWAAEQMANMSDGSSVPQFAMWFTPSGPPTKLQAQLQQELQEVTENIIRSPAGSKIKDWIDSPEEQQCAAKELWDYLEPFLIEASDTLASR
ncbi:hypothetical protein FOL47_004710, partial [Perkinsus chesapeaki]